MIFAVAVLCAGTYLMMFVIIELSDHWFTKTFHEFSLEKRLQVNEDDPAFMAFIADKVRQDHYDADD